MNPSTAKVYQKMIKSCKYFFTKNPILVYEDSKVVFEYNEWSIDLDYDRIKFSTISRKLWVADELAVIPYNTNYDEQYSYTFMYKIYRNDAKIVVLSVHNISYNDFMFFTSHCENLSFFENVMTDDGSILGNEKLVEILPKVKEWDYSFDEDEDYIIPPDTIKHLVEILSLSNITAFHLTDLPESFDIKTFFDYIKENKKTKIWLDFSHHISVEYKHGLHTIVNEIIHAENHDYNAPMMDFDGIRDLSFEYLCEKYYSK